jgi:hypothetical protein
MTCNTLQQAEQHMKSAAVIRVTVHSSIVVLLQYQVSSYERTQLAFQIRAQYKLIMYTPL